MTGVNEVPVRGEPDLSSRRKSGSPARAKSSSTGVGGVQDQVRTSWEVEAASNSRRQRRTFLFSLCVPEIICLPLGCRRKKITKLLPQAAFRKKNCILKSRRQ